MKPTNAFYKGSVCVCCEGGTHLALLEHIGTYYYQGSGWLSINFSSINWPKRYLLVTKPKQL